MDLYRTSADYDNVVISPSPSLEMLVDDFETGSASRWSPTGASAWSVVSDGSRVYRQSSTAGDARSVTGVRTEDQIIQTRAKALSFASGGERWFGLMARYVDDRNYYYLTVRNTNVISLRKIVNGTIQILDSAPRTVSTGTWYTLRLEAVGNSLRGYVNGRLLVEAVDSQAAHPSGQYGAVMYRTAAQYDNVVATQP